MHRSGRARVGTAVLLLCLLGAPAGADEASLIEDAVKALRAEFDASRSRRATPLRSKCDFFPDPVPAVSTDAVLVALRQRQHTNRLGDSYIKWQLTALLPDRLDEARVRDVQRLMNAAPAYEMRPEADPSAHSARIAGLNGIDFNDRDEANAWVASMDAKFMTLSAPLIEYRSALIRRLPPTRNSVEIAILEMHARRRAAIPITEACRSLLFPLIREWGQMSAKPEELRVVSAAVHKLAFDPAPRWVSGLKWDSQEQDREILYGSSALNDGDAHDMKAFLQGLEQSGVRPGELKLKD